MASRPPYLMRVEAELRELVERIEKLDAFTATNSAFLDMASIDQTLMVMQSRTMKSYADILRLRLARARETKSNG